MKRTLTLFICFILTQSTTSQTREPLFYRYALYKISAFAVTVTTGEGSRLSIPVNNQKLTDFLSQELRSLGFHILPPDRTPILWVNIEFTESEPPGPCVAVNITFKLLDKTLYQPIAGEILQRKVRSFLYSDARAVPVSTDNFEAILHNLHWHIRKFYKQWRVDNDLPPE